MTLPTILRRHRFRVTGDDITAVANAVVTATPLHADPANTVLGEIAKYLNPHTCGADGYGQLLGDDTATCLPRAAVMSWFADATVAGLDLFVLDNGHDDRHLNAIMWDDRHLNATMWDDVTAGPNSFPVHPYTSFSVCANVSARTSGAAASDALPRGLALADYLLGTRRGYHGALGVPRMSDIAAAMFVDTLDGPGLDDEVWWEKLPEPGADIHDDMRWQHGMHASYLLTAKYPL